jgi:hypothetical protein
MTARMSSRSGRPRRIRDGIQLTASSNCQGESGRDWQVP